MKSDRERERERESSMLPPIPRSMAPYFGIFFVGSVSSPYFGLFLWVEKSSCDLVVLTLFVGSAWVEAS
jgi:ABC-type transport system involved in cytochrome c biogenesis permease component